MEPKKPILQSTFDKDRCRHIADGKTLVLHCHHFAALTTQLANAMYDGEILLTEAAEDTFFGVLADYYRKAGVSEIADRIEIAERYYSESGLGKLAIKQSAEQGGEVEMVHSHVDEGWVKKWGTASRPVNYIGCGYVTGAFSAIYDKPKRNYTAEERQSIACGASISIIAVKAVN